MVHRSNLEELLRELYSARTESELDRLCAVFASDARFRISGSSDGKPIAISAVGAPEIRSWLEVMLKTFKLTNVKTLSTLVDGQRAAVQWTATVHSRVTGTKATTEFVDLVGTRGGKIVSYSELFVPG